MSVPADRIWDVTISGEVGKVREALLGLRRLTWWEVDIRTCREALQASAGDIRGAVEWLAERMTLPSLNEALKNFAWVDEHDRSSFDEEETLTYDVPTPALEYVLSKAQLFLRIGAERFCRSSLLTWPPPDWDEDLEALVIWCLQQLTAGRGVDPVFPTEGVGVAAFYRTMELLGLEFAEQRARGEQDEYGHLVALMDELLFMVPAFSEPLVLYNRVALPTVQ